MLVEKIKECVPNRGIAKIEKKNLLFYEDFAYISN